MSAVVIIYIKYIINTYYKLVKLFIKLKIILGRETRAEIALDFPAFLLNQIINKTRLRLDIISFYNIIRLLILNDYLLIKKEIEPVRKRFGSIEKILKNNQSPSRLTFLINNERITSNGFIEQ